MTSEEIARINQQIPGFAGMSPQQQQNIVQKLRVGQSAQAAQQPQQPSTTNQVASGALPFGVNAGLNAVAGQSGFATSGSLTASGAVPAAGTTATGAAATTPAISTNPGLAGILAGGYTGFNQAKGAQNIAQGKETTNIQKGALYPITGGLDTIAEKTGLSKVLGLGGKKSSDQQGRDQDRATLKQGGILDDDYNLTLTDGSKVNLGLDGSVKNYNVDFNEKGIGDIVALVNPFAYLVSGGDTKRASDLNGQITNAIKGSKDPKAEMEAMFNKAGLYKTDALARIDALKVDQQTKDIFKNTINGLNIADAPTQGGQQQTGQPGGGFKIVINAPKAAPAPKVDKMAGLQSLLTDQIKQNNAKMQNIQFPTQANNSGFQTVIGT